jgi:hypothetical protein
MIQQQLTPFLPPLPPAADVAAMTALITLVCEVVSNPKKAKEVADRLAAAAKEFQEGHERLLLQQRDLNAKTSETERRLERARKELDLTLEQERKAFDMDVAARRAALEADQKELTRLKQQAEKDAAAVAAARKEWEGKLAKLSALAAA